MNFLTIDNVSVAFQKHPVLRNISINAKKGETLVLMGPSGSGKTTLLLSILGFVKLVRGHILFDGKDVSNLPIEERNIGYLPQDFALFPHLTVAENVSFGLMVRNMSRAEKERKTREVLQLVHLSGFEQRKISQLSGGEKQRVALARALAIDPALLLLDEPLSNIDQVTKADVSKQLKELFQKLDIPIVLVTHNYEDVFFLADHLAVMQEGQIEQFAPLQEILEHPKTEFIRRLLKPF